MRVTGVTRPFPDTWMKIGFDKIQQHLTNIINA